MNATSVSVPGAHSNRRRMVVRGASALAGSALAIAKAGTAAAHHSYPATYDTAQRVIVSGVVQLVRFSNPHVHVVLESPVALADTPAGEPASAPQVVAPTMPDSQIEDAGPAFAEGGASGGQSAAPADASTAAALPGDEQASPAPAAEVAPAVAVRADSALVATTLWLLDLPAPNQARNLGLTPEALPAGTPLTVEAWPSRAAGSHDLAPLTITFNATGHTVRVRRG